GHRQGDLLALGLCRGPLRPFRPLAAPPPRRRRPGRSPGPAVLEERPAPASPPLGLRAARPLLALAHPAPLVPRSDLSGLGPPGRPGSPRPRPPGPVGAAPCGARRLPPPSACPLRGAGPLPGTDRRADARAAALPHPPEGASAGARAGDPDEPPPPL